MFYAVQVLDIDGFELSATECDPKKEAIAHAKQMVRDTELVAAGAHKVEVIDETGKCVWDEFVGTRVV